MIYQFRFIFVVALLGGAAMLLTDKKKLPLALRGLKRVLNKDRGMRDEHSNGESAVTPRKRVLAFVMILVAFVIAVI